MTLASKPTLDGYLSFIRVVMGIDTAVLPDNSAVIGDSYQVALEIVNQALAQASGVVYTQAVYNLAGDNLINFAPDVTPTVPYPPDSNSTVGFFAYMRQQFGISVFVAGVVSGSADQGTSQTILTPDFMKQLTMANLQNLKTPWGRRYMAFAQVYGPTIWGLT